MSWWSRQGGTVVAAALVSGLVTSCVLVGTGDAALGLRPGLDVPSHLGEVSGEPLGVPQLAPYGEGGYAFLQTQADGAPVTFDPCRPVHYVMRPDGAPPQGAGLLSWAFDQLSEATGLQFVYDGPSDEPPTAPRHSFQPERYGDRWAPVLVTWSSPLESPMLRGDGQHAEVLGRAGPDTFGTSEPDSLRYVSGVAVFNGPALAHQLGSGDDAKARAVMLHELGHLVGLGHVSDPYQVMFESNAYPLSRYRAGDLRGLELLGVGPCFRDY